eukprot:1566032-Prymnesium_polylepis.2
MHIHPGTELIRSNDQFHTDQAGIGYKLIRDDAAPADALPTKLAIAFRKSEEEKGIRRAAVRFRPAAPGLTWRNAGTKRPVNGEELASEELKRALADKVSAEPADAVSLTPE